MLFEKGSSVAYSEPSAACTATSAGEPGVAGASEPKCVMRHLERLITTRHTEVRPMLSPLAA